MKFKVKFGVKNIEHVKFFRIMRAVLLFLFLGIGVSLASNSYSQETLFSISVNNKSVKDVFKQIENNSEFIIFYMDNTVDLNRKVNLDVKNQSVEAILNSIFRNTDNVFTVKDRQIIITKRETFPQPAEVNQQGTKVTGVITDTNGESIIGASVVEKGTTNGTTTDIDGRYELDLSGKNAVLSISYLGYATQEIRVDGRRNINIQLYEDSKALEEVVVVGYGQQKKSSVVSAINTVSTKELRLPTRNLTNNLAGQLSGLIAVQRSGEPGYDNSDFWIRGVSSFSGGTSPLVLVDGVPRQMQDVEPDEIETFSLLKDAAATAVYGAEGANGVILITTKRGQIAKARISVRAETSVSQATRLPKYASSYEYLKAYNEALNNVGSPSVYDDETLAKYRDGVDPMLYPNVDWYDLLKDLTTNSRITINARGGTERAKYFVSGAFYTESGLFKSNTTDDYNSNIGVKRFNLRSNIDLNITKTTIVSVDLSGQYLNTNYPGVGTQDLFTKMSTVPSHLFPMIYEDGTIAGHPDPSSNKVNPYNLLNNSGYSKEWRTRIQSKVSLDQKLDFITKGLSYKASIAFDANMLYSMKRSKSVSQYFATGRDEKGNLIFEEKVSGSNTLGGAEPKNSGDKTIYFENSLNYARVFNDIHNVNAMVLYMQKDYQPHDQPLAFRKQGLVGRISYMYDDRYSVEGNFGYTGSETFASGHRFGLFPAVGVAWYLSNEKFYGKGLSNILNKLKLRASLGRTGNDNTGGSRFLYRSSMKMDAGGYNVGYTDGGANGGVGNGIIEGQFYSPGIGWEIEVKQNYGIELGLFDNRIDLQVDYFNNNRSDILLQRKTVGATTGFQVMPWQNFGEVKNQGLDASLVLNHTIGEVKLSARGNFTFARNKVLEYDEVPQKYEWMNVTGTRIGDRSIYICDGFYTYDDFNITGEGINRNYELKEGVVKSGLSGDIRPGDLKYRDLNGDGIINSFDAQRGLVDPENPEIVYGFGVSAEWKNFTVSAFFQGAGNTSTILGQADNTSALWPFLWGVENSRLRSEFVNHWSDSDPYNFNVDYPRLRPDTHAHNNAASTFWVRDASFLRFKNFEFSYRIPQNFARKMGMQQARIYLMGNNLCVWDNLKMWDPEMGSKKSGAAYPLPRTFTLGLDVIF